MDAKEVTYFKILTEPTLTEIYNGETMEVCETVLVHNFIKLVLALFRPMQWYAANYRHSANTTSYKIFENVTTFVFTSCFSLRLLNSTSTSDGPKKQGVSGPELHNAQWLT